MELVKVFSQMGAQIIPSFPPVLLVLFFIPCCFCATPESVRHEFISNCSDFHQNKAIIAFRGSLCQVPYTKYMLSVVIPGTASFPTRLVCSPHPSILTICSLFCPCELAIHFQGEEERANEYWIENQESIPPFFHGQNWPDIYTL